MRRGSLLWRTYGYVLAATFVALGATAYYATRSLREFHENQVEERLLAHANIGAVRLAEMLASDDSAGVAALCAESSQLAGMRFTAILPSGKVIGDSDHDPATMDNHASRPEITAAIRGGTGRSIRFSDTLQRNLMYIGVPSRTNGATVAVMRTALPLETITTEARAVQRHIILAAALAAILLAAVVFSVSRRANHAIRSLRSASERIAAGDLAVRVPHQADREFSILAESMNRMAAQLSDRMRIVTRQRNELEAVFSGMAGGVLTVDGGGIFRNVNKSAADLLGLAPSDIAGRTIQEAIRNRDLQEFITGALAAESSTEGEMLLYGDGTDRSLQLKGTPLNDEDGKRTGALVVLNDVTTIKHLEQVRHDFVANASHELRTPVTAIKGCVETLDGMAGSVPEEPRKFLRMLSRQADRLSSLIADLLDLSRIEHDARHNSIALDMTVLSGVLHHAVHEQEKTAGEKGIRVEVECPADLDAPVNDALMVQAVSNLVSNAVKYSPENGVVQIAAREHDGMVEISVSDSGPGIEKKHHERIFERFYRVDPARSRALGGTGLGLAIVKHIVLAHHGTVSVESSPGSGSVFTIRIPSV